MTTKYFVNAEGRYLGGFDGAEPPSGAIEVPFAPDDARQVWIDGGWGPVPVEPPDNITMRQLIIGLASDDWIEWPEAEAWADRSNLPAAVNAVIDQMPEEQRAAARITAKTMSVAERDNPLLIGAAMTKNPELTEEEIHNLLADAFTRWNDL